MALLDAHLLDRFVTADPDGSVVMLNLLRFVPGGADTYAQYFERLAASGIQAKYGVTIVYAGVGHPSLAGAEGGDWDMVVLVRYPSRKHFTDMVADPDYRAIEHLRADSVTTAVLQPTTPAS
jgi:uncharacterized protein (DUF1330 family)